MKRVPAWVWFFVVLAVLAATAAVIEVWFNLAQQLTPERAAAALEQWRRDAPADYAEEYTLDRQGREPFRYRATVRDRNVIAVSVNGQELEPVLYPLHDLPPLFDAVTAWLAADPERRDGTVEWTAPAKDSVTYRVASKDGQTVVTRDGKTVAARLTAIYSPEGQLAAIRRVRELDDEAGAGRAFCVATFETRTGAPLRFVHSVSATRERVQIVVKEFEQGERGP